MQDQLDHVLPYYTNLAADIAGAPLALDRTLWIHNVVALAIQNVLMYDQVRDLHCGSANALLNPGLMCHCVCIHFILQHVGKEQCLLLLWTAVWLGRAYIATSQASPFTSLRAEKTRREVVLWRLTIGVLGLALHAPFLFFFDSPVRSRHLQLLFQMYVLIVHISS